MNESQSAQPIDPLWITGQSIAVELDLFISILTGGILIDPFPDDIKILFQANVTNWRDRWIELIGEQKTQVSIMESCAYLADVLIGSDYEQVTLAIRELTLEKAFEHLQVEAAKIGLEADPKLPLDQRLIDLDVRLFTNYYSSIGFDKGDWQKRSARHIHNLSIAIRILRNGDLHSRFWFWLDRLYFEAYRPWRETRSEIMEQQEKRAYLELSRPQQHSLNLDWLPIQNPILRYPELRAAIEADKLQVCLWIEPFNFPDAWLLTPGRLLVTFSSSNSLNENFYAFAEDVAERAKAFSDPTRLLILRIIRHFGMINTEIADYLQLARPTVSIHAKILREAGLIRSTQDGRQVRHEIAPEEIRRFFRDLERFLDLPEEDL
ncbi:MAG TPA: metalloregulator ArsR/SmtB family transcription factor [Ktedonobacteraceae bacterium]|nr:metalloregulator ArsR/SmtB family transcription factor [Ktedonobacteraceae bacterium]